MSPEFLQDMHAFLVIPLVLAQRDMGALMVMATESSTMTNYARKLSQELAVQLSQTLYTKLCLDEVRRGRGGGGLQCG